VIVCAACLRSFALATIGVVHSDGTVSLFLEEGPTPWICPSCEWPSVKVEGLAVTAEPSSKSHAT
jgi:hypothetical protein